MKTEIDAKKFLEPYHPALVRVIMSAWRRWEVMRGQFDLPYKRTMAVNIHQLMVEEAKREFAGYPDIAIVEEHESILISMNGELVLRLKKLDNGLRPSNYSTSRQMEFEKQLPLEGVPEGQRVIVGYVLDALRTDIEIFIVCRQAGQIIWSYQLDTTEQPCLTLMPNLASQGDASGWNFVAKIEDDRPETQSAY